MRQTGGLFVIGLGPGAPAMMTAQAHTALRQADVVIGYEGYFAWVADLVQGKECVALPLTQEVARAQLAVERALAGHMVCVISSGDAGIYGMASVVLEVLEQRQGGAVPCDVVVIPGVSAVNACASLLGAPLGHDFAVISLSDLLTPWPLIEKRLTAAAAADFVMVLLNPKSARRHWQYGRAQEIIARCRAPETPVGVVRNAYRPDQSVEVTTVAGMAAASVDMLTTVIVGNSQTRRLQSGMLTPRGYAVRQEQG
jgi:precorrin-3B C17-methyltransferase